MFQFPNEGTENVCSRAVVASKLCRIPSDDCKASGVNRAIGWKSERKALGEFSSSHLNSVGSCIVDLNKLQEVAILRGMVHDLINNDPRMGLV